MKLSVSDNPANDPMAMLLGKYDGQKTYNGAGNLPQVPPPLQVPSSPSITMPPLTTRATMTLRTPT